MTTERKPSPSHGPARNAGRKSDDPIALGLRRLWADVESEAVPDDFLALLDEIDERRGAKAAGPVMDGNPEKSG